MKKLYVFVIALSVIALTGCGERVRIETGEVAKQLGTNGLEKEIRRSGAFRLDSCLFTACSGLSILEVFETTATIESEYYISASKLDLTLNTDIQYSVKDDNGAINSIYGRVKSIRDTSSNRIYRITTDQVFKTYIKPTIVDTIRTALNKYDIDTIMDNLPEVRNFVEKSVKESVKDLPITINTLTFSKVSWPKIIVTRREEAASVDAEKVTKLKRLDAALVVARKERELQIEKAKIAVEADVIVSKSIDNKMATWLMLEAIQTCAERETGDCNIDIHPALIPHL